MIMVQSYGRRMICVISTLVFLLVVFQAKSSAVAAALNPAYISVDAGRQCVFINATGITDKEIMVSFPSVNSKKQLNCKSWDIYTQDNQVKMPDYDVYGDWAASGDNMYWMIDLSALNVTKDNYVMIKGISSTDPIVLHFSPKQGKIKATYDIYTSTMTFSGGTEGASYEYRTQYGSWIDYVPQDNGVDWSVYEQQGATLYFREKAALAEKADKNLGNLTKQMIDVYPDGYELGTLVGREIKVKIKKLSEGPKLKLDLVNRSCVLSDKCEYRILDETNKWESVWSSSYMNPVSMPYGEDCAIEIRQMKDEGKKKRESKITRYEFAAVRKVQVAPDDSVTVIESKTVDSSVADSDVELADRVAEIYVTPQMTGDKIKGIILNNDSDRVYEYALSDILLSNPANLALPTYNVKPKKIKARTVTKTGTKVTSVKISEKDCKDKYLYVRYAAVTGSSTTQARWASDYVCLGQVNLNVSSTDTTTEITPAQP